MWTRTGVGSSRVAATAAGATARGRRGEHRRRGCRRDSIHGHCCPELGGRSVGLGVGANGRDGLEPEAGAPAEAAPSPAREAPERIGRSERAPPALPAETSPRAHGEAPPAQVRRTAAPGHAAARLVRRPPRRRPRARRPLFPRGRPAGAAAPEPEHRRPGLRSGRGSRSRSCLRELQVRAPAPVAEREHLRLGPAVGAGEDVHLP